VATTRSIERVAAAVGLLQEAPIKFEPVADVPLGGVLCALPALLGFGLLRHTRESFTLPPGFYPIETIFLVVAFLALARIRSLEALRYQAPGEWGKLLGLDRVPEVKTLREKLSILCAEPERPRAWSSTLARDSVRREPAGQEHRTDKPTKQLVIPVGQMQCGNEQQHDCYSHSRSEPVSGLLHRGTPKFLRQLTYLIVRYSTDIR
jgi:hypothetical protein